VKIEGRKKRIQELPLRPKKTHLLSERLVAGRTSVLAMASPEEED
jgi:hypothetical protein